MLIHVVQAGETVWNISVQYGVSVQSILQTNLLLSSGIALGQTLLIPLATKSYVVVPGDTLSSIAKRSIAKRYKVSVSELLTLNPGKQGISVSVGDIIQFPIISCPKKIALGFLELISPNVDVANVKSYEPYHTNLALFTYGMTSPGAITPAEDDAALQAIMKTTAIPAITFSNWVTANFSRDVVRMVLAKPSIRQQYISEVLKVVSGKGYKAIVIDFESLHPQDGKVFVEFLNELSVCLQPLKIQIIVCVMPIIGRYTFEKTMIQAYNYASIAKHSNYTMLMSYNWSWPGGPPGAVAPFKRVEQNIRYALLQMAKQQILLGLIRCGYDWILPFQKGGFAGTMEVQAIIEMCMQNGIPIQFDGQSLTPWLRYWDKQVDNMLCGLKMRVACN